MKTGLTVRLVTDSVSARVRSLTSPWPARSARPVLLLVAMGFIGELFNNTAENNYDRILAWWQESWVGRSGRRVGGLFGGGAS